MSIAIDFVNWQLDRERDNFSCLLFHLIAKADVANLYKMEKVWPDHVRLYRAYMDSPTPPTREKMFAMAKEMGIQ